MWLFAGIALSLHGWQRRLQTALMPLPFPSPSSLTRSHPTPPPYLHLLARGSGFSLSISGEGEEEEGRRRRRRRRRVVLINGRKPDDGKGRCETDRPHNLPTYQDTTISLSLFLSLSLSHSIYFSLTSSVLLSVIQTHSHTGWNSVQTPHTHRHASDRKTCCREHTVAPSCGLHKPRARTCVCVCVCVYVCVCV